MDNFTSCEEHFENLKTLIKEQNISTKYMAYPLSDRGFWESLDIIGYIKIIAYIIIMMGGLLGNLSIIMTVALIKSIRNAINFYVANLAVADAVICVICMLAHALPDYTRRKYFLGAFMCKFTPFTQTTCVTSSVLILCVISCDRFLAVFRPFKARTTEKRTSVIIVLIWFISMAVSSPFLFVKTHEVVEWADFTEAYCLEKWPVIFYRDEKTDVCRVKQYLREVYHVTLSTTLFFIPVLVMFGAYIAILHKLWTSETPGEQNEANVKAKLRSKQKVLKMVIVLLIAFVICWTPVQVILFLQAFGIDLWDAKHVPTWFIEFEWFSYYIAYANSFINPFIYGHYNKNFRKGFYLILCCRQKRRNITRFWGENIFTKSYRSLSTTISTLRSTTQAFISRRISKNNDLELPETAV